MQKTIIAGSLAMLASAKSFPSNAFDIRTLVKKVKDEHFGVAAAKVDGAKTIKGEVVSTETYPGKKYFEFMAGSTCDDPLMTYGFQMNVCVDIVDGLPMSYRLVPVESYDFPFIEFHEGHQCKNAPLMQEPFFMALGGEMFDFPDEYVPGTCVLAKSEEHYVRGGFVRDMHKPNYDHVIQGMTNKARNCDEDRMRFFFYMIGRAGVCLPWGSSEYGVFDVSGCDHGYFEEVDYSDSACTSETDRNPMTKLDCGFDFADFYGEIMYEFANCSSTPMPMP